MSYRHSSYRKLKKYRAKILAESLAGEDCNPIFPRHDTERFRLFCGIRPAVKPEGWSKPKARA